MSKSAIDKVLKDRYLLSTEHSWKDIAKRVSRIYPESYDLILNQKFIPSSPTLMNSKNKERTGTLSSCFPMGIEDSIEGIMNAVKEAAIVTKAGGGIGYDFSVLRSSNEIVKKINRRSSGPLPFINVFNTLLDSIQQGGVRRGAGMAQLSIDHPNILDFIRVKNNRNVFNRFNFSVRIPQWFYYKLKNTPDEIMKVKYITDGKKIDLIDNKNNKPVTVKQLWDKLIHYAWDNGEPAIFNETIAYRQCSVTNIDKHVLANPCSEFISIPYSSCNLGSFNLSNFVRYNKFDWEEYGKAIIIATKFMNKVISVNKYPLRKIEKITKKIRPIGIGVMGLAHLLYKLEIPYNSSEGVKLANDIIYYTTMKAMETSIKLAKKDGAYKAFDYKLFVCANARFFWKDMTKFKDLDIKQMFKDIKKYGVRNHAFTSIAPTGTISFLSNCSSGIEPVFALSYIRRIEKVNNEYDIVYITDPVFEEFLKKNYEKKKNKIIEYVANNDGSCQKCDMMKIEHRKIFVTAKDLNYTEHLDMLEVAAKNVSLSVSKTVNLPKSATEKDVSNVYLKAYEKGIIGTTVYREGSRDGILISNVDGRKIQKTISIKRPKELKADVHHFVIKKQKYYVIVGIYEDEPYEIFTNVNYNDEGDVHIPRNINEGKIIKLSRGKYILYVNNDIQYTLTDGHVEENIDALTRMISTGLRHGAGISFIVHQLLKVKGEMNCFSKVLARALKKYIKEGTRIYGESCPNCNSSNLVFEDSCKKCLDCGNSACG